MKNYYKIFLLTMLTVSMNYGQEVEVYNKSFDATKIKTLVLDLKNTAVKISPSMDSKIHIAFTATFNKYSKKQKEKYLEAINIADKIVGNDLMLTSIGKSNMNIILFDFLSERLVDKDSIRTLKTKKALIDEMDVDFLFYLNKEFYEKRKERMESKNVKLILSEFTIKVPKNMLLKILGEGAEYSFDDIENTISLNIKRGGVRADTLSNPNNKFFLKDAFFKVANVQAGAFNFNDVHLGLIGEISNAKITSDFSNIQMAIVGENVHITDFNSAYWFYSFASSFSKFDLNADYSKFHFYQNTWPKLTSKIQMENTTNFDDTFEMGTNKFRLKATNTLLYNH